MRQGGQQILFGRLPQTQRLFRQSGLSSDAGLVLNPKGLLKLGEGFGVLSLSSKSDSLANDRVHIVAEE